MSYWPEKQTAIGMMLDTNNKIELYHCFDLGYQFNHLINHNPKCSVEIFNQRVNSKNWLNLWPALKV